MTNKKQDKEKDVNPMKKFCGYAMTFAIACVLINWGIRLLTDVWLPLLLLAIFVSLFVIGWRIKKTIDWR